MIELFAMGWFKKAPLPEPEPVSTAWLTALVVLVCWVLPLALLQKTNRSRAPAQSLSTQLQSFAASSLFPVLVGSLSGLNLFTLVLTAPLILAFCTAAISARGTKGWVFVVLCNAAGTVAGSLALVLMMEEGGGTDYVKVAFPAAFASKWWARTEKMVSAYGAAGAVLISSLPVILHPLIAIAKLAGMSTTHLLGCIMAGGAASRKRRLGGATRRDPADTPEAGGCRPSLTSRRFCRLPSPQAVRSSTSSWHRWRGRRRRRSSTLARVRTLSPRFNRRGKFPARARRRPAPPAPQQHTCSQLLQIFFAAFRVSLH